MKSIKQKINRRHGRDKRGDTLIEVIFAMVIIGFIIMVAIQGALSANRAAVDAQLRTQGQLIAKNQIEAIKVFSNARFWEKDPVTGMNSPDFIREQLNTKFGMKISNGGVCPVAPLDSNKFYAVIDLAGSKIDLALGEEDFEGYKISNIARLSNCDGIGVDYGNESVQITTTISWKNRANVDEHVTLIDYLTSQSKDS